MTKPNPKPQKWLTKFTTNLSFSYSTQGLHGQIQSYSYLNLSIGTELPKKEDKSADVNHSDHIPSEKLEVPDFWTSG
jgi:hypothetical protein